MVKQVKKPGTAGRKIFVGLGNPGEEYANTYHNAGWLAIAKILGVENEATAWENHRGLFEYIETDGIVFVRPLTYMNESGKAVREAIKRFPDSSLFVFHDDSDIIIGKYKISFGRTSAGHKGVQSIIDALRTNEFTRIRIGIRPAREKERQKAGEFALKQINKKDRVAMDAVFESAKKELQR